MIPVGTDAPLYHRPIGTVLLIVANVAVFALVGVPSGFEYPGWVLEYGAINPLEWVTGNFIHFGPGHLLGNMVFLWGFGLLVEGKLGLGPYLGIYLLIGVATSAFEQILLTLLGVPGGSGGASGVIFGLIAIALIWAPMNEVSVFGGPMFVYLFGSLTFDVTILFYATWYIGWEVFAVVLTGAAVTSALLHLIGAAGGAAVGYALLVNGWVDCENWDLLAYLRGTHGRRREEDEITWRGPSGPRTVSVARPDPDVPTPKRKKKKAKPADAGEKIARHLEAEDPWRAFSEWEHTRALRPDFNPPARVAADLIAALRGADAKEEAAEVARAIYEAMKARPERYGPAERLAVATVLSERLGKRAAAAKLLSEVERAELSEEDSAAYGRIAAGRPRS